MNMFIILAMCAEHFPCTVAVEHAEDSSQEDTASVGLDWMDSVSGGVRGRSRVPSFLEAFDLVLVFQEGR